MFCRLREHPSVEALGRQRDYWYFVLGERSEWEYTSEPIHYEFSECVGGDILDGDAEYGSNS